MQCIQNNEKEMIQRCDYLKIIRQYKIISTQTTVQF